MNTRNYSTPTKRYKALVSSIHSIYRLVNSTYEVKDLIIRLARLLCQLFGAKHCTILLCEVNSRYSTFKCVINHKSKVVIDRREKITSPLEKRIIHTLSSVSAERLIGMPLVCEDVTGIIVLRRTGDEPRFDLIDQEILATITEMAVIAIKNLQLFEEHQKTIIGSIKSLVSLLDLRVPREYTHSPYFIKLVAAIAEQLRMDQKQIESLKYASLLHDAGKIDIPARILSKRSKLTRDEYRIIRNHPLKGVQILRPMQILRPVIPIIMHHHEKYNGTGYPSRLKKGQIPYGARVMAVADAFEAMVYGRPYRERMDVNAAIREIKKKSGSQFDPKVVDAFLKAIKKFNTRNYLKGPQE